jgi:hypothetical protein
MHCRPCEARSRDDATRREPAHPAPIWGAERISGLRCAHCGALLGAEDVVRLLLAKQLQLEQFGMLRPPDGLSERSELPPSVRALRVVRLEKD